MGPHHFLRESNKIHAYSTGVLQDLVLRSHPVDKHLFEHNMVRKVRKT